MGNGDFAGWKISGERILSIIVVGTVFYEYICGALPTRRCAGCKPEHQTETIIISNIL